MLKVGLWVRPFCIVSSDAQSWMVARFFFALPVVLASAVGHAGQTVEQNRFAPDSLKYFILTTFPIGFSWAMFFLSKCHEPLYSRRKCLFSSDHFVVTTPHHRCSVANMTWDRFVSFGDMLTILGFWFAVFTVLTFISHASLQV